MVSKAKHSRLHKCTVHHLLNKLWDDQQSKVRRNLFGYYESKETCQLLDQQVSSMAERSREAWNFDFLNESPKRGRYVWQKTPSVEVPLWYAAVSRPALKHIQRRQQTIRAADPLDCKFKHDRETSPPQSKENRSQKSNSESKKPRFIQTSIKDYTRVKKRRSLRLKQLQLFSHRLRSHPPIMA